MLCLPTIWDQIQRNTTKKKVVPLAAYFTLEFSLSSKRENDFETGRFHGLWMILGGPLGPRGESEEKGVTNFLYLLLCT